MEELEKSEDHIYQFKELEEQKQPEDLEICPDIKDQNILILFTNKDCNACNKLLEEINDIEVDDINEAPEKIYILEENSGCSHLFDLFNIRMYPTTIRIKNGKAYMVEGYDIDSITKLITLNDIDSKQQNP